MVVLDEVPLASVLDDRGRIEERHYPNLARLARDGIFFRNATTVSDYTRWALPALVTGRYPRAELAPSSRDHPDTLFTLLAPTHHLEVSETVTGLCPDALCAQPGADLDAHLGMMANDLAYRVSARRAARHAQGRAAGADRRLGAFRGGRRVAAEGEDGCPPTPGRHPTPRRRRDSEGQRSDGVGAALHPWNHRRRSAAGSLLPALDGVAYATHPPAVRSAQRHTIRGAAVAEGSAWQAMGTMAGRWMVGGPELPATPLAARIRRPDRRRAHRAARACRSIRPRDDRRGLRPRRDVSSRFAPARLHRAERRRRHARAAAHQVPASESRPTPSRHRTSAASGSAT